MQQILREHVVAPYEPHVPPVYAAEAPTFTTPVVVNIPYEVDQYAEMEKDDRLKDDASINAQLHGLRKTLKSLQVTRGAESLDYDDLCIHPDINMPSMVALQAVGRATQSGSIGGIKKKREDISAVTYQQGGPSHQYLSNP
ncbi:hypothetical protein H5410_061372 [Solanum commersonii]|uniref:Uncharacterized protein n=1 Tax=Solanum commersonii TaxID=4109 RepID=A0A9J5W9F9_SOLCO|nr:hypothetical protein H5410_061372 [Solanum commersonii]